MVFHRLALHLLWCAVGLIAAIGWFRGLPHLVRLGERMDLAAYYGAGLALNHGLPLYDSSTWSDLMTGIRYTPYIYPPFTAVVFRPIALLDWHVVDLVWLVINVLLTVAIIAELRRQLALTPAQTAVLALVTIWLPAWYENMLFGQVGLLITWGMVRAARSSAHTSGFCLAVLSMMKLYPALFVWPLLRGRGWWGWIAYVTGLVVTGFIGYFGVPWRDQLAFWYDWAFLQAPAPLWAPSRQGIYNALLRVFDTHTLVAAVLDVNATQTYQLAAVWQAPELIWPLWAGCAIIIAWMSWRWWHQQPRSLLERFALLTCVFVLLFPAQHNHYSIQLVIACAVLVARGEQRWLWPGALLALALFRWWRPLMLLTVSPWLMMWSTIGVAIIWYLLITPLDPHAGQWSDTTRSKPARS